MPLRYLLDENRGPWWNAIQRHNSFGTNTIDALRVADPLDLPLRAKDPRILLWAERQDRILITEDKSSMPAHLVEGHSSPGVMVVRQGIGIRSIIEYLVIATYASEPEDWQDQITYIP